MLHCEKPGTGKADAPRACQVKFAQNRLTKCDMPQSKVDTELCFLYEKHNLVLIMSIHVDGLEKGTGTSSLIPAAFDKVGNDFAGQIAEVIAYDRGLSNGVRQKIEGYLAHKWGMESKLPSSHAYKVGKPALVETKS